MNLNKQDVINKSTANTLNFIKCTNAGFMPTDKDNCIISVFNIIRHIVPIFDELCDLEKSNVINEYNLITLSI